MKYLWCLMVLVVVGCAGQPVDSATPGVEQEISVSLMVPDTGWLIAIEEVYQAPEALIVIAVVSRPPGLAGQAINTVKDSVTVTAPALPVRTFIMGKTWKWQNTEPYFFIKSKKEIDPGLLEGKRLFPTSRR